MKRAVLLASLFLAACGSACSSSEAKSGPPAEKKPAGPMMLKLDVAMLQRLGVVSAPAGSGGAAERIELPGTLEYVIDQYAEVGTLVEGRVSKVNVTVGDRVKKGDTLATVLVPAIVNAQAEALAANAAFRVAAEHAKREATLLRQELTTAREAEVARGEADRAEADLAAAESKLRLFGSNSPTTAKGIKPNGTLVLTAPLDGVVVRREVVLGAFVLPNETAFVVANTASLWAVLDVYESDLGFIREGAQVDLTVDALPGEKFTGKVAMLEPEVAKGTRALRARIIVDNSAGTLRQGFFVRAQVPITSPAEKGLVVPSAAVQPLGDRDVVFVEKEPGRYEVRTVELGRRTQHVAMITGGLDRGERIVTHGAFVLRGEATRQ